MKTIKLLFWSSVAYAILLVLISGLFTSETIPTVPLTGIPLIVITVVIVRDLARRSTRHVAELVRHPSQSSLTMDPVDFLSGQIRVAANASDSYFDDIVRARLKELLTTKIAVETGLDVETVRQTLLNRALGLRLLKDEALYNALYGPTPSNGHRRIEMVRDAVELIGAWEG